MASMPDCTGPDPSGLPAPRDQPLPKQTHRIASRDPSDQSTSGLISAGDRTSDGHWRPTRHSARPAVCISAGTPRWRSIGHSMPALYLLVDEGAIPGLGNGSQHPTLRLSFLTAP